MEKINKRKIAGFVTVVGMTLMSATGVFAGNTVYSQSTTSIDGSVVGDYQSYDIRSTALVGDDNSVYDFKTVGIKDSVVGTYKDFNIKDIKAIGKNNRVFSSDDFSVNDSVAGVVERYSQQSTQIFSW